MIDSIGDAFAIANSQLVRVEYPAPSIQEFIHPARQKPGKLAFAHPWDGELKARHAEIGVVVSAQGQRE
jgi:hypothetical protein